jgi:hypothetical protein
MKKLLLLLLLPLMLACSESDGLVDIGKEPPATTFLEANSGFYIPEFVSYGNNEFYEFGENLYITHQGERIDAWFIIYTVPRGLHCHRDLVLPKSNFNAIVNNPRQLVLRSTELEYKFTIINSKIYLEFSRDARLNQFLTSTYNPDIRKCKSQEQTAPIILS